MEEEWDHIRRATQQGRVVGDDAFQEEIGQTVGRRVKGEIAGARNARTAPLK
jgi:formylglycine-generating enzyme required for sulfatase activity